MAISTNLLLHHRVHSVRQIGEACVVRFDRNGAAFMPGQYLSLGLRGSIDMREYSIYSAPQDDWFEVLIKKVRGGYVSRHLAERHADDEIVVDGPFGFFTIDQQALRTRRFLFVASGVGISPFRCFVRAYPQLDYLLLHGVRQIAECYDSDLYAPERYIACVSREAGGDFQGRVTDWLRRNPVDTDLLCYLCGNCDMIYEAFDIFKQQGVPPEQLFAEVYF